MYKIFVIISMFLCLVQAHELVIASQKEDIHQPIRLYTIEGLILTPEPYLRVSPLWYLHITLSINDGEFLGFVRENGRFVISGVPSGSYILSVDHPDIHFQPVRVEISAKGKFRARMVDYIQPALVVQMPYPLRLRPMWRRPYYQIREQWRLLDVIISPIVIVMGLPLLLMLVLPKLINDPETKREIDNIPFPKIPTDVPDLCEMVTTYLSGKLPLPPPAAEKKKRDIKNNKA